MTFKVGSILSDVPVAVGFNKCTHSTTVCIWMCMVQYICDAVTQGRMLRTVWVRYGNMEMLTTQFRNL